jgi:twitching motility protein PilI
MAKRQSLKELQERLAQRLTVAKTEAVTATWLAVEAEGKRYLLPLVQSGEIFPWAPVHRVPYTKPWYAGVASLRGGLHGVIDLARLVNVLADAPSAGGAQTERVTSESRLVGLRNPSMFTAVGQAPANSPGYFTRSLVDLQGQSWQEIDLQVLVTEPEFLAIAA